VVVAAVPFIILINDDGVRFVEGFVNPITSSSSSSTTIIDSSTTSSTCSATELYAQQKKKPRFSQGAHFNPEDEVASPYQSSPSSGVRTTPSSNPHRRRNDDDDGYDDDDNDDDNYDNGDRPAGITKNGRGRERLASARPSSSSPSLVSSSSSRSSSSSSNSYSTFTNKQPWQSGRSIEDLESIMAKRWGSMDFAGIPEGFEVAEQQQQTAATKSTSKSASSAYGSNSAGSSSSEWRRPVLDPWDKEEHDLAAAAAAASTSTSKGGKKLNNNKKNDFDKVVLPQASIVREYYDQDDEGFEYILEDDDDDDDEDYNGKKNKKLKVGSLVGPKPVGGRGRTNKMNWEEEEEDDETSQALSYFFNPNAAAVASSNISSRDNRNSVGQQDGDNNRGPRTTEERRKQQAKVEQSSSSPSSLIIDTESSGGKVQQRPPRPTVPTAIPLLDEMGKERLFTIEEALRCFQETIDMDTLAILETSDDVPIIAVSSTTTSSKQQQQQDAWSDLGITSDILLKNLQQKMKCVRPLPVQDKTTPAILTGNDVLVGTYTGSGKTLAFLVPLVQRLLWEQENTGLDPGLAVLVIAPGRELASQIVSVTRELVQDTGLSVQLAIGGTTFTRNVEQIRKRKPNILVGTPGRIAELVVGKPGEK
jgi:hypothetical protein